MLTVYITGAAEGATPRRVPTPDATIRQDKTTAGKELRTG
jgi:hypothetical protein